MMIASALGYTVDAGVAVCSLAAAGVGSRYAARTHRRRRHARTLRNIARLEAELGLDYTKPDAVPELPVDVLREARSRELGIDLRTTPTPRAAPITSYDVAVDLRTAPPARPGSFYDGPELTDEDVRRLEHPGEFE